MEWLCGGGQRPVEQLIIELGWLWLISLWATLGSIMLWLHGHWAFRLPDIGPSGLELRISREPHWLLVF